MCFLFMCTTSVVRSELVNEIIVDHFMFHRGTIIGRKPSLLCLPNQFIPYQDIPQEDDLGPTVTTVTMD